MAILSKDRNAKQVIDLTSPQGNAFGLIGMANRLGRQIGYSKEKIERIVADMKSGDNENLIKVFDNEFGDYVDLER